MKNQVRIIGGTLRGRKINFPSKKDLRPTPDRVRETVFNWLSPAIIQAHCLELFAGSAAFSFESLSRLAASVYTVEKDAEVVSEIKKNKELLKLDNMQIIQADCIQWLQNTKPPVLFNIVFIDPPYSGNLLLSCFELLARNLWIAEGGKIYFENNEPIVAEALPRDWKIIKEKRAGQVYYYLAEKN